jgi:hypothetical protein
VGGSIVDMLALCFSSSRFLLIFFFISSRCFLALSVWVCLIKYIVFEIVVLYGNKNGSIFSGDLLYGWDIFKMQSGLCFRYNFFNFFLRKKKRRNKKNGLPDTVSGGSFSRLKSSSQLFFGLIRTSSRPNINGDVGGY